MIKTTFFSTLLISIAILYLHPPEYYLWFGLGAFVATVIEDPNVEKDIVRFWKDLPNATLVDDRQGEYLELKKLRAWSPIPRAPNLQGALQTF
ncbi:hypothetical protein MJO28_010545 [Puccinia striiformis f. sp. tritici]|uniref:Uncharacterized protein n=1 Tax=Puccinia striiformis f. sp. tritici TaxID=168172 RepID=A0ACC0E4S9_9BASI|nr:hypothetical protein MJO28_010545 [Puccinia striiformis f. sp. tritici]